jgi:hypothetical protein
MNLAHIMRAVMGLYLAMIVLWIMGVVHSRLRNPALISMVVFMYGLATGRFISLVADGIPHWLLVAYLLAEVLFGTLALWLYRKNHIKE